MFDLSGIFSVGRLAIVAATAVLRRRRRRRRLCCCLLLLSMFLFELIDARFVRAERLGQWNQSGISRRGEDTKTIERQTVVKWIEIALELPGHLFIGRSATDDQK